MQRLATPVQYVTNRGILIPGNPSTLVLGYQPITKDITMRKRNTTVQGITMQDKPVAALVITGGAKATKRKSPTKKSGGSVKPAVASMSQQVNGNIMR